MDFLGDQQQYGEDLKRISLLVFIFCLMLSNPQLQLYGIGREQFCEGRAYAYKYLGEPILLKEIENSQCRTVPIMSMPFLYSKNAKAYCFGENIFEWRLDYGNANRMDLEVINSSGDLSTGIFKMADIYGINEKCKVWQVYVSRISLLNNKRYQIVVKDKNGAQLLKVRQDNSNDQLITSFTFEEPINHIGSLEIQDIDGNNVKIKNGMYLIVEKQDNLFTYDND